MNRHNSVYRLASAVVLLTAGSVCHAAGPNLRVPPPSHSTMTGNASSNAWLLHNAASRIDAEAFFERVVQRYRTIGTYEDETRVVEVTTSEQGVAQRRQTDLQCAITSDGELQVRTPASALLPGLGLEVPLRMSESMRDAKHAFELWLAPHLSLRFRDNPLRDFRVGVDDGFTARRATPVRIGSRELVQIELSSDADQDDQPESRFDLYVDPASMLVERIEGREQLPDGATCETTLEISPRDVRDAAGEPIEVHTGPSAGQDVPASPPASMPQTQQWDEPEPEPATEPSDFEPAGSFGPEPIDEPAAVPDAPPASAASRPPLL